MDPCSKVLSQLDFLEPKIHQSTKKIIKQVPNIQNTLIDNKKKTNNQSSNSKLCNHDS